MTLRFLLQSSLPIQPPDLTATQHASATEIPMNHSWNERRKMKRYVKQTEKDKAKSVNAEERQRGREEKVLAKEWKEYYKFVSPFARTLYQT